MARTSQPTPDQGKPPLATPKPAAPSAPRTVSSRVFTDFAAI